MEPKISASLVPTFAALRLQLLYPSPTLIAEFLSSFQQRHQHRRKAPLSHPSSFNFVQSIWCRRFVIFSSILSQKMTKKKANLKMGPAGNPEEAGQVPLADSSPANLTAIPPQIKQLGHDISGDSRRSRRSWRLCASKLKISRRCCKLSSRLRKPDPRVRTLSSRSTRP